MIAISVLSVRGIGDVGVGGGGSGSVALKEGYP